jgi:hypothetical protein
VELGGLLSGGIVTTDNGVGKRNPANGKYEKAEVLPFVIWLRGNAGEVMDEGTFGSVNESCLNQLRLEPLAVRGLRSDGTAGLPHQSRVLRAAVAGGLECGDKLGLVGGPSLRKDPVCIVCSTVRFVMAFGTYFSMSWAGQVGQRPSQ